MMALIGCGITMKAVLTNHVWAYWAESCLVRTNSFFGGKSIGRRRKPTLDNNNNNNNKLREGEKREEKETHNA